MTCVHKIPAVDTRQDFFVSRCLGYPAEAKFSGTAHSLDIVGTLKSMHAKQKISPPRLSCDQRECRRNAKVDSQALKKAGIIAAALAA